MPENALLTTPHPEPATLSRRPTPIPHAAAEGPDDRDPEPHVDKVAICTPTCQRPKNLAEMLASMRGIDRTGIDLRIIVVDNDADRSAEPVVAAAKQTDAIPVVYDCIAERSLPLARNRLIELAIAHGADWIWFLDDDQVVEPDALQLMLATARTSNADCVIARVPHIFESSEPSWAQWSGIFDEVRRPTGKPVTSFGTNGALLRAASVAQMSTRFDARLKLTGGSDGLFFAHFHAQGFTSIGCNEAVLWDRVHASRDTPRWLTERAMRIGLVKGFIVRNVQPSRSKSAKWLVIGAGYGLVNLLAATVLFPLGPSRYFRHWINAARGYGIATGVLFPDRFLQIKEYATIHGE